jgi:NAD dependent epimerase/dehydratase family enzyme
MMVELRKIEAERTIEELRRTEEERRKVEELMKVVMERKRKIVEEQKRMLSEKSKVLGEGFEKGELEVVVSDNGKIYVKPTKFLGRETFKKYNVELRSLGWNYRMGSWEPTGGSLTIADEVSAIQYMIQTMESGGQSSPSAPKPTEAEGKAETWEEAKKKYLKWRIEGSSRSASIGSFNPDSKFRALSEEAVARKFERVRKFMEVE